MMWEGVQEVLQSTVSCTGGEEPAWRRRVLTCQAGCDVNASGNLEGRSFVAAGVETTCPSKYKS